MRPTAAAGGYGVNKYRVRRARRKDGTLYKSTIWEVIDPDGMWSGSMHNWAEAMEWATSIGARVEYWLADH